MTLEELEQKHEEYRRAVEAARDEEASDEARKAAADAVIELRRELDAGLIEEKRQREEDAREAFLTAEELQDKRPRVYRGGSINNYPRFLRCANRQKESPDSRWYNIGFRCALDAEPGAPESSPRER